MRLPEIYLALMMPAKDRTILAAVKAQRVMTVWQESAGTKANRPILQESPSAVLKQTSHRRKRLAGLLRAVSPSNGGKRLKELSLTKITAFVRLHPRGEDSTMGAVQLNRGEARDELARWLFFANRGEFRTGDYEEIMNKASLSESAIERSPGMEHDQDR